MERDKRVFGEYKSGRRDNKNKKINKKVIIRNKNAKIYPKKDYVVILDNSEVILGYRYIEEFYIHKDSSLPLKYLLKLLEKRKVFLIDGFGNILGEVKIG